MGDLAFVTDSGETTHFSSHPLTAATTMESLGDPAGRYLLLASENLDRVWILDGAARTIEVALELPAGTKPFQQFLGFQACEGGVQVRYPGGAMRYPWPTGP